MTRLATATPPIPTPRPITRTHHGIAVTDDFAWLRADNWQEVMRDPGTLAADVRAHLDAENAHAEAVLAGAAELRERLFEEMKGRIEQDDSSVPAPDGRRRRRLRRCRRRGRGCWRGRATRRPPGYRRGRAR